MDDPDGRKVIRVFFLIVLFLVAGVKLIVRYNRNESVRQDNEQFKISMDQFKEQYRSYTSEIEEVEVHKDILKRILDNIKKEKRKYENCGNNDIKKYEETSATSCIPFGDSPGIHTMKVPGFDAFDVLCENGWTVIQQRINGKFNFDWISGNYIEGFGCFNDDFFLGLEKIYRLTKEQPHELKIYTETLEGTEESAHYEDFEVVDENDSYRLLITAVFPDNGTNDAVSEDKNQKQTAKDGDNNSDGSTDCVLFLDRPSYKPCMDRSLNDDIDQTDEKQVIQVSLSANRLVKQHKVFIRPKAV